jgi:quinohemoprotein ethanol dehydrogenase
VSRLLAHLILIASLAGCTGHDATRSVTERPIGDVNWDRLLRIEAEPGAWLTGGRDYQQTYYSPLTDINAGNIQSLGYAWSYDIDFNAPFEATPIVVDSMMYTSGNRGEVYSIDAKSGALRWSFKPAIDPRVLPVLCCGEVNRGVAVWHGRVYVASLDGYLYALDASTGSVLWKVDTITDRGRAYSSTGAPYIANDLVVIGNGGGDGSVRGYITAYDTKTGRQAWRFYTVPADPALMGYESPELQMAAKTWELNSQWHGGLGGSAYDGMAYDPTLNLLYVGTGNGWAWARKDRSPSGGDNLFISSILAINADSGRLVWYYQTTPGDNWDYDATAKPMLLDLQWGGRARKILVQAAKNGFIYLLDRVSGELLSAKAYAQVSWASGVDLHSGRPTETGEGDYSLQDKIVYPAEIGAHGWYPMSYSRKTHLVYIPVLEQGFVFSMKMELRTLLPTRPQTFLRAWDLAGERLVWQVDTTVLGGEHGNRRAAGVMTTASNLVFQGSVDGKFRVFDGIAGTLLRSIDVGTSMVAAPMSYRIGGAQYVAIMAGVGSYEQENPNFADVRYGNRGRVVAFRLGGGDVPHRPEILHSQADLSAPISQGAAPEKVALGASVFTRHCAICHLHGRAPDLYQLSEHAERQFMDIVMKGTRVDRGMGNFGAILNADEAEAVHAYLRQMRHSH